jgi:hypothetical protein
MALHPSFPSSPYEVLDPTVRGFPAAEDMRETAYEKLLPPLVAKVRQEVRAWRTAGYQAASDTSKALLQWWFETHHRVARADGGQSEFREIVFKTVLDAEVDHTLQLDTGGVADFRSVVAFFARQLLKALRLVGGYELLYPKVKTFIREHLFDQTVDLENSGARTPPRASKDEGGTRYGFVYVDQESFEQHPPRTFSGLVGAFREFQE